MKRKLAEVVWDMPGEKRLRRKQKEVYPTLTTGERQRLEEVFPKALKQFQRHLRARHLTHLPDDVVQRIALEGAAQAVRSAKNGKLTPSFMSTRMRWELGRYWRTAEGKAQTRELTEELIEREVAGRDGNGAWRKRGQAGAGGGLVTRNEAERLWTDTAEVADAPNRTTFTRQPSLVKKRVLYATTAKHATPRWLAKRLPSHTTRQVNRLRKTSQADIAFTNATGKLRDKELKRALAKCVPGDRHREAREALLLHLTEGMSMRQLAERYGVTAPAIHKRIKKAKEKLSAYLQANGSKALLDTLSAQ